MRYKSEDLYEIWSVIKCACSTNGQEKQTHTHTQILHFRCVGIIFILFLFLWLLVHRHDWCDSRCVLTMYRNINFQKKVPKYDELYSWKSFSHALCVCFLFVILNRRYLDLITTTYRFVHLCVCMCGLCLCVFRIV